MPDRGYGCSLLAGKGHQLSGTSTVMLQVGFCRLINTGRLAPIEADQSLYRLLHIVRTGSGTVYTSKGLLAKYYMVPRVSGLGPPARQGTTHGRTQRPPSEVADVVELSPGRTMILPLLTL